MNRSDSDQRIRIWRDDWKYLIVLDACRYDFFEKIYKNYLSGRLEKVRSPGSATPEWLDNVFGGKIWRNIVYVSANPYISSVTISRKMKNLQYNLRKHFAFYKIIKVWDFGWNNELGTVHPKEVNKVAFIASRLYKNKKLIIHYMQPHAPYLSLVNKGIKIENKTIKKSIKEKIKSFIRWKIATKLYKLGGCKPYNFIIKLVGEFPDMPGEIAEKFGIDVLRQAYEENLRIVLSYAAKLVQHLKGKIVVTADHGELLGEKGLYGHPPCKRFPELIEVPWLEIEK